MIASINLLISPPLITDILEQKGIDLSDVRKNYAKQFEKLVITELKELGMPNTGFEVDIVTYNDIETIANSIASRCEEVAHSVEDFP